MKRERLYYLDLIKIIAALSVFGCHFTRSLETNQVGYNIKVIPDFIFNIYIGNFGVSLFFIISGAALMYVYDEQMKVRDYYKKRLIGIYPMFWIAFLIAFSITTFRKKQIQTGIPHWKIIYSILGMDGNALWYGPNYYQLGEWFLSVLVCLYIVFPLLRWAVKKSVLVTTIVTVAIYVICIFTFHTTLPQDCFFVIRIPEVLFGMIFIKYIKKVGITQLILSGIVLLVMSMLPVNSINTMVATTLVGIASFSVLTWILQHIPMTKLLKNLSVMCGKYCYAFFLTHHYILRWMTSRFTGCQLRKSEVIVVFFSCFCVVLISTKLLYLLHKNVMEFIKENGIIKSV